MLPDGRRQIVDLLVPGDHFGFSSRNRHILTVEAVQDSVVARYPREHVDRLADSDPAVGRYVRTKAFEAIARSYARMLIVRLATPLERVGAFLAELSERPLEGSADSSVLSLAREDLAEYLGLPVETVSRALADFRVNGAITPAARHRVTITSREAHEG